MVAHCFPVAKAVGSSPMRVACLDFFFFLNSRVMVMVWMYISDSALRNNSCLLRIVLEVNHLHSSNNRFCNILIALL